MEDNIINGDGGLIDTHFCNIFPSKWFNAIIVLTCDNTILWDRLKARYVIIHNSIDSIDIIIVYIYRGYGDAKIQENVTAEIMRVILDEAYDYHPKDMIMVFKSDNIKMQENNIDLIKKYIKQC